MFCLFVNGYAAGSSEHCGALVVVKRGAKGAMVECFTKSSMFIVDFVLTFVISRKILFTEISSEIASQIELLVALMRST